MAFGINWAYDIRLNDTFVMVGGFELWDPMLHWGRGPNVISDKLRMYLPESGTIMELPGNMKTARRDATAILVERSIFPPCS